jgi:hypothetical protein
MNVAAGVAVENDAGGIVLKILEKNGVKFPLGNIIAPLIKMHSGKTG